MAANVPSPLVSLNDVGVVHNNHKNEEDQKQNQVTEDSNIDYTERAQWLRAAVMGATDGLVSVASLMMGVGAVRRDVKHMLLAGFAGSVAGACSMAIGEFVSVYTQYDIEVAQMKRDMNMSSGGECAQDVEMGMEKKTLPNPMEAALASAFSFSIGALVPLLAAAFISHYNIRVMVVVALASLALMFLGLAGAVLGKTPKLRSCVRILVGGWTAMAITFGLTKLLGASGLEL